MKRNWGPFNGRQLTTIIVALIVGIVMIPATAWAVSFTNVAITDPGGVNRAKVSAGGSLQIGGTATEANPATFFRVFAGVSDGQCTVAYTVPTGKALILKATNSYLYPSATAPQFVFYRGGESGCSGPLELINAAIAPGPNPISIATDFGLGIAFPQKSTLIVYGQSASGTFNAQGYLAAASTVPAQTFGTTAQSGTAAGTNPPVSR
jgi:hypothetical protein